MYILYQCSKYNSEYKKSYQLNYYLSIDKDDHHGDDELNKITN